jgi:hypothetical protein
VVEVLVRDEQQIGGHARDGQVAELDPTGGEALAGDAERVDEHRPVAGDQEGRLAVPANAHRATSSRAIARACGMMES